MQKPTDTPLGQTNLVVPAAIGILSARGAVFLDTTCRPLVAPRSDSAILVDLTRLFKANSHASHSVARLVDRTVFVPGARMTHIGTTGSSYFITNFTGEAGSHVGADPGSGGSTAIFNALETPWTLMIPLTGVVVGIRNTSGNKDVTDLSIRTISITIT